MKVANWVLSMAEWMGDHWAVFVVAKTVVQKVVSTAARKVSRMAAQKAVRWVAVRAVVMANSKAVSTATKRADWMAVSKGDCLVDLMVWRRVAMLADSTVWWMAAWWAVLWVCEMVGSTVAM